MSDYEANAKAVKQVDRELADDTHHAALLALNDECQVGPDMVCPEAMGIGLPGPFWSRSCYYKQLERHGACAGKSCKTGDEVLRKYGETPLTAEEKVAAQKQLQHKPREAGSKLPCACGRYFYSGRHSRCTVCRAKELATSASAHDRYLSRRMLHGVKTNEERRLARLAK